MVEDGDRHHGPESARLENCVNGVRDPNDHVVVEFVLDHDVDKLDGAVAARATSESPYPATRAAALPPRPIRVSRHFHSGTRLASASAIAEPA